ncbi:PilN domain-containing protein [Halochromatium salexigens]|uniref:Pilus assembly protein PilN n=1 Tax=Halochromatium salexigens TaxID=49447 RepID=A0AAJ0UHV6_HALSE|nr:PilN domain-containing protein [Halochromatium salexigens]MBK5931749.1 pilus assembly protein PilN [Halochromatium salexigens]
MAHINLLPWREAARRRRQRDLAITAAAALGLVLLIGVLLKVQLEAVIDAQQARNAFLEARVAVLDRRLREINALEQRKADLLARMEVIQRLQASRPEIVHMLDQLVDAVPAGVFLTQLKQEQGEVTIEGRAQSNAHVSRLMRTIQDSEWIGSPNLLLIENKDETGTGFSHFRLSFNQQRPPSDASEDTAVVAAEKG